MRFKDYPRTKAYYSQAVTYDKVMSDKLGMNLFTKKICHNFIISNNLTIYNMHWSLGGLYVHKSLFIFELSADVKKGNNSKIFRFNFDINRFCIHRTDVVY